MFGEAEHLGLVQDLSVDQVRRQVMFNPVKISSAFRGMPHVVSIKRFLDEMVVIREACKRVVSDQACLIVFCSATPTAILAAQFNMLRFKNRLIQVIYHGNLSAITGWRTRNPFLRAMDLISIFNRKYQTKTRFVMLEHGISIALSDFIPNVQNRLDVLPHMLPRVKFGIVNETKFREKIRFGFIGGATKDKGFDTFVKLAQKFSQISECEVEFILIGKLFGSLDQLACSGIKILDEQYLAIPDNYYTAVHSLDFAIFPFKPGYYDLSPSGALLDALAYNVPVIAIRNATIAKMFDEYGALGALCNNDEEMFDVIHQIIHNKETFSSERYQKSMKNISKFRSVEYLATLYRALPGVPF